MHVLVYQGDHVIAENFVNKRIGNKNINNDRCDCKNEKKRKSSEHFVQINFKLPERTAKVTG